jgi:hypothetical protein
MRIMTMLAAVIMGSVLVGCSTVPTDPKLIVGRAPPSLTYSNSLTCAPNCTVHVLVNDDCKFEVTPLIVLSGIAGTRHVIVWVIQSQDYVFSTASGTPALDPKGSGSFFGSPVVHGRIMNVDVTVSTPRLSHEYGLNIVKKSGTVCPKYDPYVIE